ncbi:MAG: hypothetical protein LBE22_09860 [Azoarcus sp.]|nr:hypothetical protein [Azoarcus sp.]
MKRLHLSEHGTVRPGVEAAPKVVQNKLSHEISVGKSMIPVKSKQQKQDRLLDVAVTWPFLLALLTLLINDWWLKSVYPNVITGKLSDFAGIAVLFLLLGALFPRRLLAVTLGITAVFLWWKSPLSALFIQTANDLLPYKISRTVDYTDLMALCVMPLCNRVLADSKRYALPWYMTRRFVAAPILGISLLGIMGTSFVPSHHQYSIRPTNPDTVLDWSTVAVAIKEVAEKHGFAKADRYGRSNWLTCENEPNPDTCSRYKDKSENISMIYSFHEPNIVSFKIVGSNSSLFFSEGVTKKMKALRNALKNAFAERFPGLEYVEPLCKQHSSSDDCWHPYL